LAIRVLGRVPRPIGPSVTLSTRFAFASLRCLSCEIRRVRPLSSGTGFHPQLPRGFSPGIQRFGSNALILNAVVSLTFARAPLSVLKAIAMALES
jgi:hypothetical protein